MKQIIEHDMNDYVRKLQTSFAMKRDIYTEYQSVQFERGFDFGKPEFVKEKYPRFPNRLRKVIIDMI